jgi:hypothetical protein
VIGVAEWLQQNSQLLNEQTATLQRTSQMIEQALGIAATDQTIEQIGRSVGVRFQVPPTTRRGGVLVVAQAVADLYGRLGEPVPEALGELLMRMSSGIGDVSESNP